MPWSDFEGGTGDDVVDLRATAGSQYITAYGGDGDDVLFAGPVGNALIGGSGVDELHGGEGRDFLGAEDGVADAVLDCGGGELNTIRDDALDPPAIGCQHDDDFAFVTRNDLGMIHVSGSSGADELTVARAIDGSWLIEAADPIGTHGCEQTSSTLVTCPTDNGISVFLWRGDDRFRALDGGGAEGYTSVSGDQGDDVLFGGDSYADSLNGGFGNDRLFGGAGPDFLSGTPGSDLLVGGPGQEWIYGGSEGDRIRSGAGADRIYGDSGRDEINAGADHDRAPGGGGRDEIRGGSGDDELEARDRKPDLVACGPGEGDSAEVDASDNVVGCERLPQPE